MPVYLTGDWGALVGGTGDTTVLYLPGGIGNAETAYESLAELERGYRVIVGHSRGNSHMPTRARYQRMLTAYRAIVARRTNNAGPSFASYQLGVDALKEVSTAIPALSCGPLSSGGHRPGCTRSCCGRVAGRPAARMNRRNTGYCGSRPCTNRRPSSRTCRTECRWKLRRCYTRRSEADLMIDESKGCSMPLDIPGTSDRPDARRRGLISATAHPGIARGHRPR